MMRWLLTLLALAVAADAAAQVYRWTDENGRTVYGSQPPPSAKANVVQDRIQSYSAPPEVRHAAGPRAGAADGPVTLYATDWCQYCAKARAYFTKNRIRYVEYDIEKNPAARAEYRRLGGRGVPLIAHGGSVMTGFSEQSFEAFIRRSRD